MTRTGLKIGLDVSEMVSNAGRAAGAISKLTDAMAQAEKEGRRDDIGKFAHEIERLQGRNVGFDKEFRNILANPGTQGRSRGAVVEIDSGYEEAVRSQMAAMNRLTAGYEKAVAKSDITEIQKISSLLDAQYGEVLGTFREARSLPGKPEPFAPPGQTDAPGLPTPGRTEAPEQFPVPHKPRHGETNNPLGGLLSSAETLNEVIRGLDTRIAVAKKDGEDSKVGELYYAREKLKTSAASLERDTGGMLKDPKFLQIMDKKAEGRSLTQGEEKHLSRLDTLNDTLRRNTEALLEANRVGDTEELLRQSHQVGASAADLRKAAGQGDDSQIGRGMQGGVMSLALGHISNAINSGLSRWTGSLDRSGIVAQYGSGDIRGAQLAERRRQDNLAGGAADTIAGMSNLLAFLGPKGILAAGAINLGASVFNSVRQGQTNLEATDIAKAELWQQRSGQAMELAALIGNPGAVRESFGIAADAAARFGFSAEEGMAAMNQAAQQGLDRAMAEVNARRVFDLERRTGADRGALSSLANMSARFNAGDALGDAWAGLNASGMSSGQFNEYLRAMQRVMEDGISRGFVRSSEDVAKNLTMLAQLTGGDNPLWQGEHGARRLSEMNAGLEAATALSSASDVIALRAAMDVEREYRRKNEKPYEDISWIYGMKRLERGLDINLFDRFMTLSSNAEGGAMEGIIHRMMDTLGLNNINAYAILEGWRDGRHGDMDELRVLMGQQIGPPAADSRELEARGITEGIRNWWTTEAQGYWDRQLGYLRNELRGLRGESVPIPTLVDTSEMAAHEAAAIRYEEYREAIRLGDMGHMRNVNFALADAESEVARLRDYAHTARGQIPRALRGFDRTAQDSIGSIIGDAANYRAPEQLGMAQEVLSIFEDIGPRMRRDMNDYKVNRLANSNGIEQMLALLRELITATREGREINLTIIDD